MTDEQRKLFSFEDDILKLIDNQDDFTRSDLQGVVSALVRNIYNAGMEAGKKRHNRSCTMVRLRPRQADYCKETIS